MATDSTAHRLVRPMLFTALLLCTRLPAQTPPAEGHVSFEPTTQPASADDHEANAPAGSSPCTDAPSQRYAHLPGPALMQVTLPSSDATPEPATISPEEELEVLIIQALDQPTDLDVEDVPIRRALQQLGENTGIPIALAAGTTDVLPYGAQTRLSATIEDRPLRESLTALLQPLGLTFAPTKERVLVKPTAPLERLCRRATWDDLAILETLTTHPFSEELFASLAFQFQDTSADDASANRRKLIEVAASVGAGTAAEVLEHACGQLGWTWYPSGEVIAVLTQTRQVERQLETRVSLRYAQVSLTEALTDLANRAGVLLRFDPGVMNTLPPQTAERFSLTMENATVRQALEVIAGETGLGYFIEPEGVRVSNTQLHTTSATPSSPDNLAVQAEVTAQATAAALRSNSIVGQLTFPMPDGSTFSFFIRHNDLPPEVNQMRESKIQDTINHMRRQLYAEQQQD